MSTSITTRRACLIDECVSLGEADRPAWRAAAAAPLQGRFPRSYESGQIGDRPALREYSAGRRRQTGQFGDPAQRLIFGVDRTGALEPRSAVDIRRADEHVERSCRRRSAHSG